MNIYKTPIVNLGSVCSLSTTMAHIIHTFVIFTQALKLAAMSYGPAANNEKGENCVDISRFGPVIFNDTALEQCSYRLVTQCTKKSKELCVDIPQQECKFVSHVDCKDFQNLETAPDDIPEINEFVAQDCVVGDVKVLTEMKSMPVCETVTKQQCDSKWVFNSLGEKIWAGKQL